MAKKILLICPYFGTLPSEYFQLILDSCSNNKTINWLLITDDRTQYEYPDNVKVVYQEWKEFQLFLKEKIKSKLNLSCIINNPYKLCDYKPLFGIIFEQYLRDYDYWGNTDLTDTIYGNLRDYLTPHVLTFDKINYLGHMTLYRNTDSVNYRVKLDLPNGSNIKEILTSDKDFAFDEVGEYGIQRIYENNDFSFIRLDEMVADVSPLRFAFQLSKFDKNFSQYYEKYRHRIFTYDNGNLMSWFLVNDEVKKQEFGYIHFQKRKMKNNNYSLNNNHYMITSSEFVNYNTPITASLIKEKSHNRLYLPFFILKWKALKIKIKKIINRS